LLALLTDRLTDQIPCQHQWPIETFHCRSGQAVGSLSAHRHKSVVQYKYLRHHVNSLNATVTTSHEWLGKNLGKQITFESTFKNIIRTNRFDKQQTVPCKPEFEMTEP